MPVTAGLTRLVQYVLLAIQIFKCTYTVIRVNFYNLCIIACSDQTKLSETGVVPSVSNFIPIEVFIGRTKY